MVLKNSLLSNIDIDRDYEEDDHDDVGGGGDFNNNSILRSTAKLQEIMVWNAGCALILKNLVTQKLHQVIIIKCIRYEFSLCFYQSVTY
jgi:hypothetical protein